MSGSDSGERSEKATEKHLREARQKGRISRSRSVDNARRDQRIPLTVAR